MGRLMRMRTAFYMMALVCSLSLVAGCAKQRAQLLLKKANNRLQEAQKQEAEKYAPDSLQQSRENINRANQRLNQRQYSDALASAKEAARLAEDTLTKSKTQRANVKINDAKAAIDVADLNEGSKQDPERYEKIQGLYAKAKERLAKNKWDAVIDLSDQVMNEVDLLLNRLRNEAERKLQDVKNSLLDMRTQEVQKYAPEYVIEVTDYYNTIEQMIKVKRDYLGAKNQSDRAIAKAEEGILKTKEKKSQEQISTIESDLSIAIIKGAEIYAPDRLKSCVDTFEAMVKDYFEKKFDTVLMTAEVLKPQVKDLIYVTRQKAANAKIEAVVKAISALVEGGAKEYLPGRVEVAEQMLAEARAKFDRELFEETETVCQDALRETEKIEAAFNEMALDAMRSAADALDIAQRVFDKMQTIFIINVRESMTPLEVDFENAKEAMKENLRGILENARLAQGIAKVRQEEKQYKKAILMAGDVKKSAEYVLSETYHVVAHNAITELAAQITRYERDGAREYVPEELDRTKELLEEAKALLSDNKYKDAVNKASETRAQLEVTVQELSKKAVANIEEARRLIEKAPEYETDKYKAADLNQSIELLAEAERALRAEKLKPALETAFNAAKVASAASLDASRLWAQDEIQRAKEQMSEAEEAGASTYAASVLEEARKLNLTAQNLFSSEDYITAKDTALQALKKAREALYKRVTDAETAINDAKVYEGWKYNYELLAKAIVHGKLARESLDQRDYVSSHAFANRARTEAEEVITDAKNMDYAERIKFVKDTLNLALTSGVNYFRAEDAKQLFKRIAVVEDKFTVENYDYVDRELSEIEAKLSHLIEGTPTMIADLVQAQRNRLKEIMASKEMGNFDPEVVQKAEHFLTYATEDFGKQKYASSYRYLRKGIALVNDIAVKRDEEIYRRQVAEILDTLSSTIGRFNQVLKLGPDVLMRLAFGPEGESEYISIAGADAPTEFRSNMDDLVEAVDALTPPPTKSELHKEIVQTVKNARLAAMYFEKLLILEEFDHAEIKEIITKAFTLVDDVKRKQNEVQSLFLAQQKRFSAVVPPM
jgi:hypothetical protein